MRCKSCGVNLRQLHGGIFRVEAPLTESNPSSVRVEDALTLFKGECSSMGCVIVTDSNSANIHMYMEGDAEGDKSYLKRNVPLKSAEGEWVVDPSKKTCVLHMDGVHFCAVVGKEWGGKPDSENPMPIAVSADVQQWLDEFDCMLWPSTGKGFCGLLRGDPPTIAGGAS